MLRQLVIGLSLFLLAFLILAVSIFRVASPRYVFNLPPPNKIMTNLEKEEIEYELSHGGKIAPDHFLWPLIALRDKLWLLFASNSLKKAEISLLLADKRLYFAQILLAKGKFNLAAGVIKKEGMYLAKALSYLEEAKKERMEVGVFAQRLAFASLKHRQLLEEMRVQFPEDAQPLIVEVLNTPKLVFEKTNQILTEVGIEALNSPFEK